MWSDSMPSLVIGRNVNISALPASTHHENSYLLSRDSIASGPAFNQPSYWTRRAWTGYVAGLEIPRGYPSVGGKDGELRKLQTDGPETAPSALGVSGRFQTAMSVRTVAKI